MPRIAQPAGSEDALEPVGILGNLVRAAIIRTVRANPGMTVGPLAEAIDIPYATVQARIAELEAAGMVIGDPPGGRRRGTWIRYHVNDEAVTDLYLRLGIAIGEF